MKKRCFYCGEIKEAFVSQIKTDFDGSPYTIYFCYDCFLWRERK